MDPEYDYCKISKYRPESLFDFFLKEAIIQTM